MAQVIINDEYLTDIAEAIRTKRDCLVLYKPKEMAEAIRTIESGGAEPAVIEPLEITTNGTYTAPEGVDGYNPVVVNITGAGYYIPASAFHLTNDCSYTFAGGHWDWFVNQFRDQITSNKIENLSHFADDAGLIEEFPTLNIYGACKTFTSAFSNCLSLRKAPTIVGNISAPTSDYEGASFQNMFSYCYRLTDIPDNYFSTFGGDEFWEASHNYSAYRSGIFDSCYSLRKFPNLSILRTGPTTSPYQSLYSNLAYQCRVLDELKDVPVYGTFTSNATSSGISYACRLKAFTFETNEDGSPVIAKWKSQTYDFSRYVGWSINANYITGYSNCHGCTVDHQVVDDATYQALKDNPNWWTLLIDYSRYNHDSAVETIKSLPDTSAYGTNIIKFKGAAGALTDGGAINTLTEEEIAVATAKGWTVSLV